jgi:hypothetical protein
MSDAAHNDQAITEFVEEELAASELGESELIESDADLLQSGAFGSDSPDAREFPRIPFRGRAKALVLAMQGGEEPQECEVLTTDVSRGGLSLLHRKRLLPGQQILLVLNDANRLVEVCWCCRVWPGLYSAGCRFVGVPVQPE